MNCNVLCDQPFVQPYMKRQIAMLEAICTALQLVLNRIQLRTLNNRKVLLTSTSRQESAVLGSSNSCSSKSPWQKYFLHECHSLNAARELSVTTLTIQSHGSRKWNVKERVSPA